MDRKKGIIMLLLALLLWSCGGERPKNTNANMSADSIETGSIHENLDPHFARIDDIRFLLENVTNVDKIDSFTERLGFKKKFNGVYITNESDENGLPISWIKTTNFGGSQNVSFMTCQVDSFKALIGIIKKSEHLKIEKFNDGTSDIATRLTGAKFSYEIYIPKKGIDTRLNDYDEVIIYYTKKD